MKLHNLILIVTIGLTLFVSYVGFSLIPVLKAQQQQPQIPPQKQQTQLTPQEQALSHCPASVLNSSPPLKPGAFPVCPGSPLLPPNASGPSQAQIQADIASHQADSQKGHAILDELFKRIGSDTSQTHVAAVLKQMQSTYPGVVHCPGNVVANCYVIIRAPGVPNTISPPIAP